MKKNEHCRCEDVGNLFFFGIIVLEDQASSRRRTPFHNRSLKQMQINRYCSLFSMLTSSLIAFLSVSILYGADNPERYPLPAKSIQFKAFDGSLERYLEYAPPTFDESKTTTLFIILHGHGSDCEQGFSGKNAEFRAFNDVAETHNAIVVSPDYRAKTSWMGPAAEKDLVQIIEEQKAKRRIDRVVLSGGSMGASSTFSFIALHPELIDGAIACNGTANHIEYENFQDAISTSFGGSKSEVPQEYKNRSGEYFPERFLGIKIAVTLGGQDTVVPPDSARRLASAIQKLGGEVLVIDRPEIGHWTNYDDSFEAASYVFDKLDAK